MECNRDEAVRAKEIAEKKFTDKDITGARKFAVKAQTLYPELEGIQQMISTFDIYISAEKSKVNGESDMYAILGTKPLSDDETVRKQYRKLALLLHPDKNKSIGAEGAFKYISEAWSTLSDKTKKLAYDRKRTANGFYNFAPQETKAQKSTKTKASTPKSRTPLYEPNPSTFWTVCHRCKMQYEYLRKYLNQNLLCPNCHKPFLAIETGPPCSSDVKTTKEENFNFQWGPFSGTCGASSSAQAASMVQQTYEKVKREREAAQAAKKKEEALRRKRSRKVSGVSSFAVKRRKGNDDLGAKQGLSKPTTIWDFSHAEIQSVLTKKAKVEIQKKLGKDEIVKDNTMVNGDLIKIKKEKVFLEALSVDLVHSDFHDFDKVRRETCFEANQVWAAYDYEDGMPRKYAFIHQVISLNPFKLQVGWLNSRTKSDLSSISWAGSLFSVTTGEFKIGQRKDYEALNAFSHMVKWTKDAFGDVHIYPKKGDVWALYRNWSPEWNELTEYEAIHKYELVEILEGYDEKVGVCVIPLVKVASFKAVFHRHMDPKEVKIIPRTEMVRFSHQIPSHLISSLKGPKAPIGCRELDPAAIPSELLTVIIDVEEEKILRNDENTEMEKIADGIGNSKILESEDNPNAKCDETVEIKEKHSKSSEEKSGNARNYEEVEILKDRRES